MRCKGFTLIELLIVVAIIAILAAIAVPNFMEAQMRARYSRAKSDMRSIATAVHAYRVDNNRHPVPMPAERTNSSFGGGSYGSYLKCPKSYFNGGMGHLITSPIAYISAIPIDPFPLRSLPGGNPTFDFNYNFGAALPPNLECTGIVVGNIIFSAHWFFASYGPLGGKGGASMEVYDPTNGTVSAGMLWWYDTVGLLGGGGK